MVEICNLYRQTLENDTVLVMSATEQLLTAYADPSNIQILLQIINEVTDLSIISCAIQGLYQMLKKHWFNVYNSNPNGAIIQQQILFVFQKYQTNNYISNNIADCLQPILYTQGLAWTNLISFLNRTITESTLKVVFYLLKHNLKTPEILNPEIINFYISIVERSISTNNASIAIQSSFIFSLLSSFLPIEYSESLSIFFNSYISLFGQNPDIVLAKNIGKSFNANNVYFDPNHLLFSLLEFASKSNPVIYFITIRKLISKLGKLLLQHFPTIIQTTIGIISSLFSDDCYDDNVDSKYIAGVTYKLGKNCNSDNFCSLIVPFISAQPNGLPDLYSILEIVYSSIDCPNLNLQPIFGGILNLLTNSLSVENHTIVELSLLCVIELIHNFSELFEDNAEDLFNLILPKMSIKHYSIIDKSARALSLILLVYPLNSELILSVLPSFVESVNQSSGVIKADMILAICGFVFQMREAVQPFIPSILPLVVGSAEDSDIDVQKRVIETLGAMLLYAPEQCDSVIEYSMNLFIKSLDNAELVESAFFALTNALKSSLGIDPFIEIAIMFACRIATPDDEVEITGTLLTNIEASIKFLNKALKFRPEACAKYKLMIIACCTVEMTDEADEDVIGDATMAILRAFEGMEIPEQEIEPILLTAESSSKIAVRSSFKGASYILKNRRINDGGTYTDFIVRVAHYAMAAMKRELPCQLDDMDFNEYDNDLFDYVIKFLSCFAEKKPTLFPFGELFDIIASNNGRVSKFETERFLQPFASFKKGIQNMPHEVDQRLFDLALLLASQNCITKWPFTILRIVVSRNDSFAPQFPNLIEVCSARREDLPSALALLFFLATKGCFNIQNMISDMINSIPIKGDVDDIASIWFSMFSVIQCCQEIVMPFNQVLVMKCANTLNRFEDDLPGNLINLIVHFILSVEAVNQELIPQLAQFPYVYRLLQQQQQQIQMQ